jgi:hypothetical protein
MDSRNGYNPLPSKDACALLNGTKRHCVDDKDCGLITDSGKSCPVIADTLGQAGTKTGGRGSGLSSGGSAGIAICVIFFILVILIGGIFYYRRKYRKAKVRLTELRYLYVLPVMAKHAKYASKILMRETFLNDFKFWGFQKLLHTNFQEFRTIVFPNGFTK